MLYIKGSLLWSYHLQDQPQLSSANDHQQLLPLRMRRAPWSSLGAQGSGVGLALWELSEGKGLPLEFGFDFFCNPLSHIACLLHVIQRLVSTFLHRNVFWRTCEYMWGMKDWQEGSGLGALSSEAGEVPGAQHWLFNTFKLPHLWNGDSKSTRAGSVHPIYKYTLSSN